MILSCSILALNLTTQTNNPTIKPTLIPTNLYVPNTDVQADVVFSNGITIFNGTNNMFSQLNECQQSFIDYSNSNNGPYLPPNATLLVDLQLNSTPKSNHLSIKNKLKLNQMVIDIEAQTLLTPINESNTIRNRIHDKCYNYKFLFSISLLLMASLFGLFICVTDMDSLSHFRKLLSRRPPRGLPPLAFKRQPTLPPIIPDDFYSSLNGPKTDVQADVAGYHYETYDNQTDTFIKDLINIHPISEQRDNSVIFKHNQTKSMTTELDDFLRENVAISASVGRKNEDTMSINTFKDGYQMVSIFDGHGNKFVAHKASREIPASIWDECGTHIESENEGNITECIQQTITEWDNVLKHKWEEYKKGKGGDKRSGGSTFIGVVITPNKLITIWLGDSEARFIDESNTAKLAMNFEVHTPDATSEKQRLQNKGLEIDYSGFGGPPRVGLVAVSRAFGDYNDGEKDGYDETYGYFVSNKAGVSVENKGNIKMIILGCDGIWDAVKKSQLTEWNGLIEQISTDSEDLGENANKITDFGIEHYPNKVSRDDMSVILVNLK